MARMSGKDFHRNICRQYQRRFGRSPSTATAHRNAADPPCRMAEIAELAEAVADERCPRGVVQPTAIATAADVTWSFGHYGGAFDGMLEHERERFHIYCNLDRVGDAESPRARFTLAHELGHYYIDEHRRSLATGRAPAHPSQCDCESTILAEQEADHFAAHLLMPSARFNAQARRSAPGLAGILSLAHAFQTSIISTAIRYAAADIAPCAVVKWTWRGFAWKWLSSFTFQARLRRTFEQPGDLAEGSPTRLALAHHTAPACGYFESGTVASAWFPRVELGEPRDVVFIEQAMPLGRHGVLTFLRPADGHCEERA